MSVWHEIEVTCISEQEELILFANKYPFLDKLESKKSCQYSFGYNDYTVNKLPGNFNLTNCIKENSNIIFLTDTRSDGWYHVNLYKGDEHISVMSGGNYVEINAELVKKFGIQLETKEGYLDYLDWKQYFNYSNCLDIFSEKHKYENTIVIDEDFDPDWDKAEEW